MMARAISRHAATPNASRHAMLYGFSNGVAMVLPTNLSTMGLHATLQLPYMKLMLGLEVAYGRGSLYDDGSGSGGRGLLPDVEFIVTTEDEAPPAWRAPAEKIWMKGTAPLFRYGKTNASADLLVPIFHFGLKRFDSDLLNRTAELNTRYPWPSRLPVAFGRFSRYTRMLPDRYHPTRLGAGRVQLCISRGCRVRQHFAEWAAAYAANVSAVPGPLLPPAAAAATAAARGVPAEAAAAAAAQPPPTATPQQQQQWWLPPWRWMRQLLGGSAARAAHEWRGVQEGEGGDSAATAAEVKEEQEEDEEGGKLSARVDAFPPPALPQPAGGPARAWNLDISLSGRVPMESHAAYKYLVHLDGIGLSSRLEQLLVLGSLLLREESGFFGFYHHLLRPHVHYLPFWSPGSTPEDLLPALDWAAANDDQARRIAEAGQAFAVRFLNAQARHCYVLALLQRYAGGVLRYRAPSRRWAGGMVPLRQFVDRQVLAPVAAGEAAAGRAAAEGDKRALGALMRARQYQEADW